jgi:hypothetical protein
MGREARPKDENTRGSEEDIRNDEPRMSSTTTTTKEKKEQRWCGWIGRPDSSYLPRRTHHIDAVLRRILPGSTRLGP